MGACVYALDIHHHISLDTLREHQVFLQEYIAENYSLSIVIYFLVYFIIVSLSIPVATIMTFIGGFLFGQYVSVICIVTSSSCGACVIFLSSKLISQTMKKREVGKWIQKIQAGFAKNAFSYIITLRLMPIFPFVIVNIVSGILNVSLKTFFFGTFIGIIPSRFIQASVGVSLQTLLNDPNFIPSSLLDSQIIFSLIGLALLAVLPIIYKYFKKKKPIQH